MNVFSRLICRILIASTIMLSFGVNAGMVATDQMAMSAQDLANRDAVLDFITRENVASELQAMGISSALAQERVAAMTQEEVNQLAGKIETLPAAGAMAHAVVILLVSLVVALLVYFIWYADKPAAAK